MVNFLVWLHPGEKLLADMAINPTNIEIQISNGLGD